MLIEWPEMKRFFKKPVTGVLHVGAHKAEERMFYGSQFPEAQRFWVEANRKLYVKLMEQFAGSDADVAVLAVVGDVDDKEVVFNIANNGESSSILKFGTHAQEHPEVKFKQTQKRMTRSLQTIMDMWFLEDFNFLNLDIQGAELLALKGLGDRLNEIDYIYSEVNEKELYEGCGLIGEIDELLSDFERVVTKMTPHGWGDALYVRKSVL